MTTILDPEPALHNDRAMTFLSFALTPNAPDADDKNVTDRKPLVGYTPHTTRHSAV
jgi:hypothetical protein